jgi:hypothetical protein
MKVEIENAGPLIKENYHNPMIEKVINSNIQEYDIKSAHTKAIEILYGVDSHIAKKLNTLDKTSRNIEIGKMMINNKDLVRDIQSLLFLFKKEFILKNNIKASNIIETTKDSLVLINKVPMFLTINVKGIDIEFVNKDGLFSSYYRLKGNKSIFFDNITKKIRIKGINKDIVENSTFVKKCLIPLMMILESSVSMGPYRAMKSLKSFRYSYINSEDKNIYKSLENNNKFLYLNDKEIIESDYMIPDNENNLIKINNYVIFVMPLIRSIL